MRKGAVGVERIAAFVGAKMTLVWPLHKKVQFIIHVITRSPLKHEYFFLLNQIATKPGRYGQIFDCNPDVLYDMGSAGNNVTGFTPTLSSMGSAILSNNLGQGVATPLGNAYVDDGTSMLPPLVPNR